MGVKGFGRGRCRVWIRGCLKQIFSIDVNKETGLSYIVLVCEEITCWLLEKKESSDPKSPDLLLNVL